MKATGNVCNGHEACHEGGFCLQESPPTCYGDGNPCTVDSCDPIVGCLFTPVPDGTSCNDANACTVRDACTSGACAGVPVGEYRLEVAAPGYRTFVVAQLPLVAGDVANARAILDPGNAADVVMGATNSVTSRVGTALVGKSVSDLPENQRNFVNLVQVSAGANEKTS